MAAALQDSVAQTEQRLFLHGVKWETYKRLAEDLADCSAPRLSYDRGTLEIMSPTPEYERANRTLALLVEVTAEELEIDIDRLGSTTFRREDLARGFEPDSCFYIQSVNQLQATREIDLSRDPPPDLVIEIDITRSSLQRFPIFSRIGVPEVWRYDGAAVSLFALRDGEYIEIESSAALPLLSKTVLTRFLQESEALKSTAWLRQLRHWIRQQNC